MTVAAARVLRDGTHVLRRHRPAGTAANLARRLARPRPRARLRVRRDRRQARPPAAVDRRRHPRRDRRRRRRACPRCSTTGCSRAASTSASSAPPRSTASATSTPPSSATTTHPKVRLPGAGGAPEIAANCGEVIVILRQSPARVRRAASTSSRPSATATGRGHRQRLGLRGDGPTKIITDLGILEPDPRPASSASPRCTRASPSSRPRRPPAGTCRSPTSSRPCPRPPPRSSTRCAPSRRKHRTRMTLPTPTSSTPSAPRSAATAARSPGIRPDDLAAHVVRPIVDRSRRRPGPDRRRLLRRRQRRGRGQPRRRPHGRPARRPADDRPRGHRQPPLRLGPGGGDRREPRASRPATLAVHRRRRRVDEPRALGAAEARARASRPATSSCGRRRSAGAWSTRRCRSSGRSRWASPPRTSPTATRSRREAQDAFALKSHQRAHAAWEAGFYDDQVIPYPDAELERDEGIRADTSLEKLAKLQPAFRKDGTVTAGNASPLNDGAGALLIGDEAAADRLGREPLARIAGRGAHGVDPDIFGIAPVEAANKALERAGIGWDDLSRRAQRGVRLPVAGLPAPTGRSSTPRTSTRTAARSPSATRSGAPARASSGRWRTRCAGGAGATAWPPSASASARGWPSCWRRRRREIHG